MNTKLNLKMIEDARETIKDIITTTPLLKSEKMSKKTNANVYIKCENLQKTGSFKVRGACNKIANLTDDEKSKGVIASSAGNHAQGVALGATMSNIKATIVMPSTAPLAKVSATKDYGANVILNGLVYDDAYAKAIEIQKTSGATFLHPFDDEYVMAGQGTIGLEVFEQLNGNIDTIICPIGGGGLIAGVATAAKALNPNVKIIGVQTANIPSMYESLKNKKLTTAFKDNSIADGISVKTGGRLTFEIIKNLVDEIVLVEEDEIAQAMLFLLEYQKMTTEGSGAVSTAAIWSGKYVPATGENVVCIASGGNVDTGSLYRIIDAGLIKCGRRFTFRTHISNKPGGLSECTTLLSDLNANILNAQLSKMNSHQGIGKQLIEVTVETFGHDHIAKIKEALESKNFKLC